MKRNTVVVGAIGLVLFGALAGWWLAQRPSPSVPAMNISPDEVLYWYDPMYPQQHFDKPGKSPFMDMELVPRRAGEIAGNQTLKVAPAMTQSLGVRLAKIERVALENRIDASGVLSFDERAVAVVQSRFDGFVDKVWPLASGDLVKAGAPLVEFRVPEWTAAQQEFLAIRASGDTALLEAARLRLQLTGMEQTDVRQLENSGVAKSSFLVSAPIDGVIQELQVRQGMSVSAGQTLLRLNGLGKVWLEVAVPETLVSMVHVGDRAEVRLAAATSSVVQGRVGALLPALNDSTRTLRVRVELPNPAGTLRPGQSAQVMLNASSSETALSVPTEAVIRTGKRSVVMVAEQDGFRPVQVTLGQEVGDRTVIATGLTEGQQVVASGQFLLDSEASLRGLGVPALEESK